MISRFVTQWQCQRIATFGCCQINYASFINLAYLDLSPKCTENRQSIKNSNSKV